MDKANYLNDGTIGRTKYPMSTAGFDFIQNQVLTVHDAVANIAGAGLLIISGCQDAGNAVTAGQVCINNEILPFNGGTKQSTVRIVERSESIVADYVTYLNAKIIRYVEFGSNVNNENTFNYADFVRLKTNAQLNAEKANKDEVMPKGTIIMWNGTVDENSPDFPTGFKLCNGQAVVGYGTVPDLSGKFIVGYKPGTEGQAEDYSEIGLPGGEAFVQLNEEHLPPHNHSITGEIMQKAGSSTQEVVALDTGNDPSFGTVQFDNKVGYTGEWQPHENRPPYYVLAYLIKVV